MEELDQLLHEAPALLSAATDRAQFDEVVNRLTGRSSPLAEARRRLANTAPEERPALGKRVNEVSESLERLIASRRQELERLEADKLLAGDRRDVTLEVRSFPAGSEHIIQQALDEVCEIFVSLGYAVATGPEAELAHYNFDSLNIPKGHPSRFESDTLYINYGQEQVSYDDPVGAVLLRTHTSPMQARWMESHEPPVHVVVPGRVFRADTLDATHSPVFHQIEGLAVDDGITMADLRGTLSHFAKEFFGADRRIRLYPSYFPFTEPSAEMAVSCFACDGSGCRVCSGTGWIELMGCGMVDPNVFEAVGYDQARWSGFAFGMGGERLAMVRHGITHISHLYQNDLRVLGQF